MRDLRKKALLESKKTTSRKARSRDVTPATSKRGTPITSRATSRVRGGSSRGDSEDDIDSDLSDETSFSVGSIDGIVLNGDNAEQNPETRLADLIEEIFTRKGSSIHGRETAYKSYVASLTRDYLLEEIQGKEEDLVAAFLRSVKEEDSEKETILALKAISITLITSPSDLVFDVVLNPLKRAISDTGDLDIKSAAIHALGACTFYGGASDDGIIEVMDFLLEIISTDGRSISAPDEPTPVIAATQEWALLCTLLDDVHEQSQEYIEAFAEQINSSYPSVQIAAGEAIALLFEKSFKALDTEEDGIASFGNADIIPDPDDHSKAPPKLVRLYPAYRRTDQLLQAFLGLSRNNQLSVHHMNKDDRKALKSNFSDFANSIENPHAGPKYSNALQKDGETRYGSRMTIQIHGHGSIPINKWWKFHRLNALRRILQGGFIKHYEENEVVFETLPVLMIEDKGDADGGRKGRATK